MKKEKVLYWSSTSVIALFEGLMPALTSQTELAKEGIRHLGYPMYFGNALVIFKILGVLALVIPQIPKRVKEWAYAGFAFNLFVPKSEQVLEASCIYSASELIFFILIDF